MMENMIRQCLHWSSDYHSKGSGCLRYRVLQWYVKYVYGFIRVSDGAG